MPRPKRILRVFLSSTAEDLLEHRKVVAHAIEQMGHTPEYFEHTWTARGGEIVPACIKAAEGADLVVVMVAHRYGWVPTVEAKGDGRRSITWIEHDAATARNPEKVLGFIVDPKAAWTQKREQDALEEEDCDPIAVKRAMDHLKEFRAVLGTRPVRPFSTPDTLAKEVIAAIYRWEVGGEDSTSALARSLHDISDDRRTALAHHLRSSVISWRRIPLVGIDPTESDAGSAKAPDLDSIYISLNATPLARPDSEDSARGSKKDSSRGPLGDGDDQRKPLSALTVAIDHPQAVLLGDPGGGKSTFLKMLAVELARRSALEIDLPLPDGLPPGEMASRFDRAYFPVLVVVRDFAADIGVGDVHERLPGFIARTVGRPVEKGCTTEPAVQPILSMLREGHALLMLDGLDEVVRSDQRAAVLEAIHEFAVHNPRTRILVTCRVAAYEPEQAGPTADAPKAGQRRFLLDPTRFPVFKLSDFDESQREDFVERWYAAQSAAGRLEPDPQRRASSLIRALRKRHLQRMAGNPLLLTVMAIVHGDKGDLPEQRVLLYRDAVEILLRRWRQGRPPASEDDTGDSVTPDTESLETLLKQAETSFGPFEGRLWQIARDVHGGTNAQDGEAVADIPRSVLVEHLATLHRYPTRGRAWAEDLVEFLKHRSGLLVERRDGVFTVPHRTFQEYLAARALAKEPKVRELVLERRREDIWREVILMVGGTFAHIENAAARGLPIVEALLGEARAAGDERGMAELVLAADFLAEMTEPVVRDVYHGSDLWKEVATALRTAMFDPSLPVRDRATAGSALGRIGDRRFTFRPVSRTHDAVSVPEIELSSVIPAGPFPMGNNKGDGAKQDAETPRITSTIVEPFQVGLYPVTVAQYRHFVEAGGYRPGACDQYWTSAGLAWRNAKNEDGRVVTGPALFDEIFQNPNHPQAGVSWYEAVAFCRWLSAVSGTKYRLPTEIEWERAARDTDARTYPWGEVDPSVNVELKANILDDLGHTSPVGLFLNSAAACGAVDTSGNVCEWCNTIFREHYGNYPKRPEIDDDNTDRPRVLRGGSWYNFPVAARCATRNRNDPVFRSSLVGFRLCVCPCCPSDR